MSKFSDQLSASLANIPIYNRTNVSKCARGSGLVTRHPVTCDITPWHHSVSNQRPVFRSRDLCCPITGQYSGGGKCHCPGCYGDMWPQSGPIVPAPASSGQTEYFMRAETEERQGWFNGRRCFNKIIEWTLLEYSAGRNDQLDSLLAMFKGIVIKMKLSFVPTWAHHVFVDFCRLSTEPKSVNFMLWWESSYRFLYLYFSVSSVRDERRKKVVICPLCLVSSLVLFTFCWASYLFWTAL